MKQNNYHSMKKLILLALAAVIMAGCIRKETPIITSIRVDDRGYEIRVVDSCEYLRRGSCFAHKGNCKFCKERRQKELEELVERLKEK